MGYYLLINGVYWGYNPPTNHLLTSWDIQVCHGLGPLFPISWTPPPWEQLHRWQHEDQPDGHVTVGDLCGLG